MNDSVTEVSGFRFVLHVASGAGLTDDAQRNRQLLLQAYQGIERGDQSDFLALLHPSVKLHEAESLPYGGTAQGLEQTLAVFGAVMAAWSRNHVTVEEITAAGDLVIAYMHMSSTAAKTGKSYEGACAEVFRFSAGKVVEWRPLYWDTHAAREALLQR
jgi:ketosteroid isomerase-like protein